MQEFKHIKIESQSAGIISITFDCAGEKINTLSCAVLAELSTACDYIEKDRGIRAVIIKSAKKDIFIAGADISEIQGLKSEKDALEKVMQGQDILNKLAKLSAFKLALIDGACIGGGLELALACDGRIATKNPKTKLALPEVNLGIIPGFGGTQRLPKLIGLVNSLDMILSGKSVDAKKALKLGLVDDICDSIYAESIALSLVESMLAKGKWKNTRKKLVYQFGLIRLFVFESAKRNVIKATKGQYPAPLFAINVIKKTFGMPKYKNGFKIEAKAFAELAHSEICKNLISVFYASEAVKKEYQASESVIENVFLLGAGVMGGGIAAAFAKAGIRIRIKDIALKSISLGMKGIFETFTKLVKKHKMKQWEMDNAVSKITSTLDFSGIESADIIIEAIVEDLAVKQNTLAEIEPRLKDGAIVATNTSSLTLKQISEKIYNKSNFVGMHFFNPVSKMPLVEVVRSSDASKESISAVVALTRRIGKVPVVVGDCNGFVVNRVLFPFMNEAMSCLTEFGCIEEIDKVLIDFGMPMGVFLLADEVGIDVCYKVSKILSNAYGDRFATSKMLESMHGQNLLGKKGGKGFYVYSKTRSVPNKDLPNIKKKILTKSDMDSIRMRCFYIMINEASRLLEEGHVSSASALDICMIMGVGFPAFRGGLLKYADNMTISEIHSGLLGLCMKYGKRFAPSELIIKLKNEGETFYSKFN